jgi:hypothetical protein
MRLKLRPEKERCVAVRESREPQSTSSDVLFRRTAEQAQFSARICMVLNSNPAPSAPQLCEIVRTAGRVPHITRGVPHCIMSVIRF